VLNDELMKATLSGDDSPELDSKAVRGALDALNEMFPGEAQDIDNDALAGETARGDKDGANDRAHKLQLAADAAVRKRLGAVPTSGPNAGVPVRARRAPASVRIDDIFARKDG
jgi:hypothetical protein